MYMKWIQISQREGSILEESLAARRKFEVVASEIGTSYSKELIVRNRGRFVLAAEEQAMTLAQAKIQPRWHYMLEVNRLEAAITEAIAQPPAPNYELIFDRMSRHLAYYGLAKLEAEVLFAAPETPNDDKQKLEQWRNFDGRWKAYDEVWRRVSSVVDVPVDDLHWLLIDEVEGLLNGEKVDVGVITARKASVWTLVVSKGSASVHLEDMSPIEMGQADDVISGQTGYSDGQIINGVVGQDILVTKMTSPDMMTALKGVRAVVTDEGGILCHAAITCRELKIPCVVGTKVATHRFREGDRVEVNASKGAVRKL